MSVSAIQRWLHGSYSRAEGIALLEEHGKPTNALLSTLRNGEAGYARERLVEALTALLRASQAAHQASPQPRPRLEPLRHAKAALSMFDTKDDWPRSRYPVEIQEADRDAAAWLAEQDTLMGELRRMPDREQRYRTALRIKELDDLRHAVYFRKDTYRTTGTDIGNVVEVAKSLAELKQELLNLRTYISRARKGTRPSSPEQVASWKARIGIIQTTLDAGAQG